MKYFNLLFFAIIFSFTPLQDEFVIFQAEETEVKKSQEEYRISLPFKIIDGYYIQAETDVPENIISTQVSFKENDFYQITHHAFSSEGEQTIYLDTTAHNVLSGRFEIVVFLKLKDKALNRTKKLRGEVLYQACNTRQCFYPRNLSFEIEFI
ncbi:hypothetical protein [Christiangramia crocea]|uniref:Thiol:disulfide interchange protein DsbD N-terminal domain-containing protein n=1 Tax=Christiangramia crocea TaxID=2904124 RepID=A0A9X1UW79_9FLAO|nr:hypothetical protein [Gramella crocea]MCG9971316.1 hypothetical protein [Gramella crocea]